MKICQVCFFYLLLTGLYGFSQNPNTRDLGGAWKFRKTGTGEWMNARVPGCVHLDLLANGTIKDPFYRDPEKNLQWIGESGWEYKKEFDILERAFADRHIELVCEGLDTYAKVYINDSLVIVADNMFREWIRDIKSFLFLGKNVIRIQFASVPLENKVRYEALKYKLPGDEKVVCRKAAYQFGWDFSPAFITCGVWKPVYLRSWSHVNVLDVHFIQKNLSDSLAKIRSDITLVSDLADSAYFTIKLENEKSFHQAFAIKKGKNTLGLNFEIINPELWWPNGLGKPFLYKISYEVRFAGHLVGKGEKKIGLRTISLVQKEDSIGRSFYFLVNGLPVFAKGANYIPPDSFLPRVSDSFYHQIICDAKSANMNMLRVWGGGVYEKDLFYDLCDENGMMVWQDFMFACAMYPGENDFLKNVLTEVEENIIRLRNHPCIALWCGNNEIDEGWKNWGWQKQYDLSIQDSSRLYDTYRSLFNRKIPELVGRLDTLASYVPSSPLAGWGHPESLEKGDVHYWGVWWGQEPFSIYTKKVGRFMSEYGFQGFPELSSIIKFTAPDDRLPDSRVMRTHQKHPIGFETIDAYMLRDFRKPKDFSSYILTSQLLQAEGIKSAIEAHRRGKPRCMGTLVWQLNDCWPGISWSAIDYYGRKKAVYYRMKDSFHQTMLSPVVEEDRVKVYVVTDSPQPIPARLLIRICDFNGNVFLKKNLSLNIPANSSTVCFDTLGSAMLAGLDPAKVVLSASLYINEFESTRNLLYFVSPQNLSLQIPAFKKTIDKTPKGYLIKIKTDKLAKGVCLSLPLKGEFSDNYFDMLPGEIREIVFETSDKSPDILPHLSIKTLIDTY